MTRAKKTSVEFFDSTLNTNMSKNAPSDPIFGMVVQDNFSSDMDREEFMQTITSNGIAFLRCANTPLPKPTKDDLNLIDKLAKILSGLWSSDNRSFYNDA